MLLRQSLAKTKNPRSSSLCAQLDTVIKTEGMAEKLDERTTALTPALSPEQRC